MPTFAFTVSVLLYMSDQRRSRVWRRHFGHVGIAMVGRSTLFSTIDGLTTNRPSTSIWSCFKIRRSFEFAWMKIILVHVRIIQGHALSCWTLCLVESTAVRGVVPSVSHMLQPWGVLYRLLFICLQWSVRGSGQSVCTVCCVRCWLSLLVPSAIQP